MRRIKQQDGKAMIGWILLLGSMILIATLVLRIYILPMYYESLKITYELKALKTNPELQIKNAMPKEIKEILLSNFNFKKLKDVTADEITVLPGVDAYHIRIRHQFKQQIVGNWYLALIIDESVNIPMRQHKS